MLIAVTEARAKATQVRIDVSQLTDPEKLKQFQDAQNADSAPGEPVLRREECGANQ